MNYSIERILTGLRDYFSTNRQVGHTKAMIEGAGKSNCIVVVHDYNSVKDMTKQLLKKNKKQSVKCLSLAEVGFGELIGHKKPLLLDNAALYDILTDALHEIKRLKKINELK